MLLLISGILLFIFLYPYIFYPFSLKLLPKAPEIRKGGEQLRASLLFCAFNEENALSEKLQNVRDLKSRYGNLEVLAYDDGSTDRTYEMLNACSELTVVRGPGRQGKASGMKLLAAQARADILIFTDANVTLDVEAISNLSSWFNDPQVGGVCGVLKYYGETGSDTARIGGLYWRLEESIKRLESRTGNVMGADGSIFAIRKSLYPSFPETVLDDLTVSMECIFRNFRLVRARDVVAFERLVSSSKDEFARKIRIAARAYHTHLFLRPRLKKMDLLDRYKYLAHKYIRWWGGLPLVLGLLAALAGVTQIDEWAGLMLALATVASGIFFGKSRTRVASSAREILLAIIATSVGIWRALIGQTYATWSPAQSR